MTDELTPATEDPGNSGTTRLSALKALAAGAAGVAAGSLLRTSDAAAIDGSVLTLGSTNTATSKTVLTVAGQISNDGALSVSAPNADSAIIGNSNTTGVTGTGGIGVVGIGTSGGFFSGTVAAISLDPPSTDGAPAGTAFKGDLAVDAGGVLYLCVNDGTPGTWVPVSGGSSQLLSSPQRLFDSRLPGPFSGSFAGGPTRTIDVTAAGIGVPANARAIVGNLTVTETNDVGFLTAYPAGLAQPPTASNLNWAPGQTIANAATVKLGASGRISLYVERSSAQVIVDVVGYLI